MQSGFLCSDFKIFVLYICLLDYVLNVLVDVLLVFFLKLFYPDGLAVLNDNRGLLDPGHVVLKAVSGVVNDYWNNGTAGLLSNLKASFVELAQGLICFVPGALGIDED